MKHNINEVLILALADKNKEARLRSICIQLKSKGKTKDYNTLDSKGEPVDQEYLELVRFGISGCTLKAIADVIM
jgi:hypothetical protein